MMRPRHHRRRAGLGIALTAGLLVASLGSGAQALVPTQVVTVTNKPTISPNPNPPTTASKVTVVAAGVRLAAGSRLERVTTTLFTLPGDIRGDQACLSPQRQIVHTAFTNGFANFDLATKAAADLVGKKLCAEVVFFVPQPNDLGFKVATQSGITDAVTQAAAGAGGGGGGGGGGAQNPGVTNLSPSKPTISIPFNRPFATNQGFTVTTQVVGAPAAGEQITKRYLTTNYVARSGDACNGAEIQLGLNTNVEAKALTVAQNQVGKSFCVKHTVLTNFGGVTSLTLYQTVLAPAGNAGAGQGVLQPSVEIQQDAGLTLSAGQPFRLQLKVNGRLPAGDRVDRRAYEIGYVDNNGDQCVAGLGASGYLLEEVGKTTNQLAISGTVPADKEGKWLCARHIIKAGTSALESGTTYQQVVAAPGAGGAGAAPANPGGGAGGGGARGGAGGGAGGAGNVAPPAALVVGGNVALGGLTPETVAAGAKTLTFKFRPSGKLGKEVKYRGTLAPKNSGGQVTYYFTTPKNAAKIQAIAGSQSVNAKGKAVLKTAVPVQLKAKRNYWVVAEYTSPTGETIRAVRKFKANAP